MNMEEYIRTLTEQIRCVKARDGVADEIRNHITDQTQAYEQEGMLKSEALEEAVKQMGDPVETGVELDHIHRPRLEWKMLILIGILSVFELLVQYSIGNYSKSMTAFQNQCIYTVIGFLVMLFIYFVDYTFIAKFSVALFLMYTTYFVLFSRFGIVSSGTKQQLIMPIYLYVPIMAGILYRYRGTSYMGVLKNIFFMLVPVILSVRIIPSISTGFNMSIIFFAMLFFSVWKNWFKVNKKATLGFLAGAALLLPVLLITVGYYFLFAGYQKMRLMALIYPSKYQDFNYTMLTVKEVIQGSQLFGKSSNIEESIVGFLPTVPTEYVFTHLVSCYGIMAGIFIIILLVVLIYKVFHISIRQKNQLGMMIGIGCGLVFFVECIEYVLMNLGIGISNGGFLPFFSYGRNTIMIHYILLGMLLSIYRYKNILVEKRNLNIRHSKQL
jgi:cell division protein FtsW (lipid II flippase)